MILVAENVIKDSDTSNISVINIYEDLTVESFPIIIQRLTIIIFLEKQQDDPDIFNTKLKVTNNQETLLNHEIKVDFRGKNKNRAIIRFGGIMFPNPGFVRFTVYDNDEKEICFYNINLRIREDIKVTSNPS